MEIQRAKVVDLSVDYAVVITDRGAFKRIVRKGDMSVGNGIYFTNQDLYINIATSKSFKWPVFSKRLLQMTGVMALLIMILFTQSFTPLSYAVISVDINPSIQLFIDADYNVVKIEGMNADGKNLLSEYEFIKKKSASSVITELFTLATEMDYLKSDQNEILIAAAIYETSNIDKDNRNETDKLIDAILSEVDYSIFEQENVVINAVTSNSKSIEAAEKEHLTIGNYEKDNHSGTVKPYAIVEDGKHIKTKKVPNENANTPADTSNDGVDDKDKVRDRDRVKDKDNDNDKDDDSNLPVDADETNKNNGTSNGNNNSSSNNGNGNEDNNGNDNSNGNGNIENNIGNDENKNKGNENNNKDENDRTDIKPNLGIGNVKGNVENSNFANGKNKKKNK